MEVDFNLAESLAYFKDQEKDSFELGIDDPEYELNRVTEELAVRPSAIDNTQVFDSLEQLSLGFNSLSSKLKYQLTYLVSSSLTNQAESTREIIESGEVELFQTYRKYLELYGYLLYIILSHISVEGNNSGSSRFQQTDQKNESKKTNTQIETGLESITHLLRLPLSKLFQTTPERNAFVGLFTNAVFALMENQERVKVVPIKLYSTKIICLAVKYHGQSSSTENSIMQHLTYFNHLSSPMAELLEKLSNSYDYSQLTDEVLKEVSQKEFNENDTNAPKSISQFLIRLSELIPRVVMKQVSLIAQLLDNSSFTLRCAVVEVVGNIITDLAKNREDLATHKEQADSFIELLEARCLDQNPYVRGRALQGLTKLTEMEAKFNERRLGWTELSVRHLDDKSGIVRRNAIKLLNGLILTHPYDAMHGERLQLSVWNKRMKELDDQLKQLKPDEDKEEQASEDKNDNDNNDDNDSKDDDEDDDEDDGQEDKEMPNANEEVVTQEKSNQPTTEEQQEEEDPTASLITTLELTRSYYSDAITFMKYIEIATELASELLYSKNKNEVIDAMNFFVLCDAYGIETADIGIRKMLHLVWLKGNNEEANAIVDKLIECYVLLFLNAKDDLTPTQKSSYIASNLIKLTYNASMADLTSLEKLLGELYEKKFIDTETIKILWQFYSIDNVTKIQRHGSIIVLGMLSAVDHKIALKGLDLLLTIGLDSKTDDWVLTKFSCIALRRIVPTGKQEINNNFKVAREEEALNKLSNVLTVNSNSGEWYGMASEALNAIYSISLHPDVTSSNILKRKCSLIFANNENEVSNSKATGLSQLLFLIGHIALKTIIHLEKCEAEFKKKKIAAEVKSDQVKSDKQKKEEEVNNELDMIGGTNEDDFTDAVTLIKEREILYGDNALLAKFVPLIKEIVKNPKKYDDINLQRHAVLCLEKLMCVSPKFCEENLSLFLHIMETSKDPIIRSNSTLGLGDMAVCFNNIVDTNKDQLYGRLHDDDLMVQRTCLMTVTFLILAGQVKVKGQLAQMAKLLENEDQSISDMSKLFFTELATKDNAIYNEFMDMFSGLSADKNLSKESFKKIIKFVIPFIEKERHKTQLCNKLYQRMLKTDDQSQWNDISFVLNALGTKNEEILKTIQEGFKVPEARE